MDLKRSIYVNIALALVCAVLTVFIMTAKVIGNKRVLFDLKNASVEIEFEDDAIDTAQLLQSLIDKQGYATLGILNGLGFYAKDDVKLLNILEADVEANPLVAKLRNHASNLSSIFSNRLLPVTVKVVAEFSDSPDEVAACKESEYFNKQILLASEDETRFFIGRVENSGACSTGGINMLYVTPQVARYLSGCIGSNITAVSAKVQLYDSDSQIDEGLSQLCGEPLQLSAHRSAKL